MKFYDITPTISEKMAVFPGDCSFQRNEILSFEKKNHLTLSNIKTTLHIGAHADAPNHYHADGVSIDQRSLEFYMGPCQVVHAQLDNPRRIQPQDIQIEKIVAERVLFRTDSFPDPDYWNSDFSSLSPELVEELAKKNVKLVGIDTPSVDPEDSKKLESHNCIYKNDLAILEGIVLSEVPEGLYQLIALPLKIKGADASPVRAILLPESSCKTVFSSLPQAK